MLRLIPRVNGTSPAGRDVTNGKINNAEKINCFISILKKFATKTQMMEKNIPLNICGILCLGDFVAKNVNIILPLQSLNIVFDIPTAFVRSVL